MRSVARESPEFTRRLIGILASLLFAIVLAPSAMAQTQPAGCAAEHDKCPGDEFCVTDVNDLPFVIGSGGEPPIPPEEYPPDLNPGDGVCCGTVGLNILNGGITEQFYGCTLRGAIVEANAHAGEDVIDLSKLALNFIFPLLRIERSNAGGVDEDEGLTGDFDILGPLEIVAGEGQALITAQDLDRVFEIHAGPVTIRDLIVVDGVTSEGGEGSTSERRC
jgi:hypothetical protein